MVDGDGPGCVSARLVVIGDACTSIFDADADADADADRALDKTFIKVVSRYDNEWDYSSKCRQLVRVVGK